MYGKGMPEVMHTRTMVIPSERDSALVEYLAKELVHGIGME